MNPGEILVLAPSVPSLSRASAPLPTAVLIVTADAVCRMAAATVAATMKQLLRMCRFLRITNAARQTYQHSVAMQGRSRRPAPACGLKSGQRRSVALHAGVNLPAVRRLEA